jgi:glycosyltransferase involved in cell wall biosynthesis
MVRYPLPKNAGIDVCVVTHNHGRYLSDCLDSILGQSIADRVRVWIHDDCSTDNTVDVARWYEHRHRGVVTVFSTSENLFSKSPFYLSESVNRNFANFVSGSFVSFIDGDDFWSDSKKLASQVSFLNANPGYSMAFHGVICVDDTGKPVRDWMPESSKRDYSAEDLRRFDYAYIHLSAALFRNTGPLITSEMLMAASGDMFIPHFFGIGGGAKYMASIAPSCYRQTLRGAWTSKSDTEKFQSKLHFSSLMVARLLAIGDIHGALSQVATRVVPSAKGLLASTVDASITPGARE